jgi:hypothetical protein
MGWASATAAAPRPASPKPPVNTNDDVAIRMPFLMGPGYPLSSKNLSAETCECVR